MENSYFLKFCGNQRRKSGRFFLSLCHPELDEQLFDYYIIWLFTENIYREILLIHIYWIIERGYIGDTITRVLMKHRGWILPLKTQFHKEKQWKHALHFCCCCVAVVIRCDGEEYNTVLFFFAEEFHSTFK